jgi:glycogen debranching enzyme
MVAALLAEAGSPRFGLTDDPRLLVPSYDRTAADFDPLRYWRGPVWININWLLWRGLREHGRLALAGALRRRMLELIERSGCYEYFHPLTGAGIGSPAFSWTAALALDLLASPEASSEAGPELTEP